MIALLALLANVAITVVSAQDYAQDFYNIHGFDNQLSSGCGSNVPVSCSVNPPPSDLCCYESPGVSQISRSKFPLTLTLCFRGCFSKHRSVNVNGLLLTSDVN